MAQEKPVNKFYRYAKFGYSFDVFTGGISNWHTGLLELKFQKEGWQFLPGATFSNRFDQNGLLTKLDIYKSFDNNDYMLFDMGFSPNSIFPNSKLGVEYYNPFGMWEHSVGVRWLSFDQTGDLGLLTASLSRYYGAFLTILRLNAATGLAGSDLFSFGGLLQHRYYLSNKQYLGLLASYGYDASLFVIQDNVGFVPGEENPYQFTLGLDYRSATRNEKTWNFQYKWTHYNFIAFQRNQHTVGIFLTLHSKGL